MDSVERIAGADRLISVFGYCPSFHDAEVLWLRLDRQGSNNGCYGPTLEAMIHAFEMTSEVGADGFYVLRHHVLVHFSFREVVDLQLDGFNPQNALMGLELSEVQAPQAERVRWSVCFDPAFGVGASFRCYAVEVVSVIPCDKDGRPLPAERGATPECGST